MNLAVLWRVEMVPMVEGTMIIVVTYLKLLWFLFSPRLPLLQISMVTWAQLEAGTLG